MIFFCVGRSSGRSITPTTCPAPSSLSAFDNARSKFRLTTEDTAPSQSIAAAMRYPSLGGASFRSYCSQSNSTTRRCDFFLANTASATSDRSVGSAQSPFWSTPSATSRRCTSTEHSRATGTLVGASTEHPAPTTIAIFPPPWAETARNNSSGKGIS